MRPDGSGPCKGDELSSLLSCWRSRRVRGNEVATIPEKVMSAQSLPGLHPPGSLRPVTGDQSTPAVCCLP